MKTTDLKAGHCYRLKNGQTATIESIFGRGRNRQVRTNVPTPHSINEAGFYSRIIQFAAQVTEDLGLVERQGINPMRTHERIRLEMTGAQVVECMCEGNPGAFDVVLTLMLRGHEIDPQHMLKGFGLVLSLDSIGLYGSDIWLLYKNVCSQDLRRLAAVLRGSAFGFVSREQIVHAVRMVEAGGGPGFDVDAVCLLVKERLPQFKLTEEFAR